LEENEVDGCVLEEYSSFRQVRFLETFGDGYAVCFRKKEE
jgi:hypothetical protein